MRVLILGSGSSGNVAILESEGTRVMVDAGLNPTTAALRMRELGEDLFPRAVDGIVITHQHGDHIAHAEPLARATRAPVFLHDGVEAVRLRAKFTVMRYDAGAPFRVGAFEITACALPHDAPQVALRFEAAGVVFVLATDLGHVPGALVAMLRGADAALVEANHCPELLERGPYPPRLKRRVSGPFGHLSNGQAADLAGAVDGSRLRTLYLGHLSVRNNTPDRALATVAPRCPRVVVSVVLHGRAQALHIERAAAPLEPQLELNFG